MRHGSDVQAGRGIEVPASPVREAEECRTRSNAEVVVLADEVEYAARVDDGAVDIASETSQPGSVHGDPGRQRAERIFVRDDHR